MKKFLKVFLVIILIIGAIAGTVFFFFKFFKEKVDSVAEVSNYIYADSSVQFNDKIKQVDSALGSDARFDLIMETRENLEDSIVALLPYMKKYGEEFSHDKVVKELDIVKEKQSLASEMIAEFQLKSDSPYYPKSLGANDLYVEMSNMLVSQAQLVKVINNELSNAGVDKSGDIKFTLIDVYADVVITSFDEFQKVDNKAIIKDIEDIEFINTYFAVYNGCVLNLKNGSFSYLNNKFVEIYSNCNKSAFADNLKLNSNTVSTWSESLSNELKATYYFEQMYGIS